MKIIVCVCLLLFVTEYSGESSALTNHRSKHEVEATPESAKVEAISESAKNAVRALKKLEARYQAGISYRDYAPALGDATFEVNMFMESDDSKKLESLAASIKKTLQYYAYANTLWGYQFTTSKENKEDYIDNRFYDINSDIIKEFLKLYPEANKSVNFDFNGTKMHYSVAIAYVFSAASKELANSFALLNNNTTQSTPTTKETISIPQQTPTIQPIPVAKPVIETTAPTPQSYQKPKSKPINDLNDCRYLETDFAIAECVRGK